MAILITPTSDNYRLSFITKTVATYEKDSVHNLNYISQETIDRVKLITPEFETQINSVKSNLTNRSKQVDEKNSAVNLLQIYIRDMWSSVRRKVVRENLPAQLLMNYSINLDGSIKKNLTGGTILTVAAQMIEGDKKAVADGYNPISNPSAEELENVLEAAKKETADVSEADRSYDKEQDKLSTIRAEIDDIIDDIIAELKFNLRKMDSSSKRRIMRSYGAEYKYQPGEPNN